MSSDNTYTLLRQYRDSLLDAEVGLIKARWARHWIVFTNTEEAVYPDWQTAIKVAYGERTP